MDNRNKSKEYYGWAVACVIGLIFIFFMAYSSGKEQVSTSSNTTNSPTTSTPQYNNTSTYSSVPAQTPVRQKGTCRDVTTYDYNWNNDMLCTRPDGSTFYTNYQGARDYLSTQ